MPQFVRACQDTGIKAQGIITDTGPCNQGLWGSYGFKISKKKRKFQVWHPTDSNRRLYFFANVPHLLKNLREHFTEGDKIELLDNVVKKSPQQWFSRTC